MELFFKHCSTGEQWRRLLIVDEFPNFPDLNDDESERWLWQRFKKFGPLKDKTAFDSGCIDRLIDKITSDDDVYIEFRSEFNTTRENSTFSKIIDEATQDAWAVGQRWKALF
jgi:hypothetical protein